MNKESKVEEVKEETPVIELNKAEDMVKDMEIPKDTSTKVKKTVKFNKPPQTQKQSKVSAIYKELAYLHQYSQALDKATADIRNNLVIALLEIYKVVFKDCPTFKEVGITKETASHYQKVIGLYYKKDDQILRIIPIEDGWKMSHTELAKYDIEIEAGKQKVEGLKVQFKFEGISPDADYPTTFECFCQNGHESVLKLKEYLYSIKNQKEILTNGNTTNSEQ